MSESGPQLIIQLRDSVVQTLSLRPGVLVIGRIPGSDVVLAHPLVARRHAELRLENGAALIVDLESASGTFLGGERLLPSQPALLADGAVVQIGPFALVFRAAVGAADEPPAAVALPKTALAPAAPPPVDRPRRSYPAAVASGPLSRYLLDLPAIYQEADFLGRFLLIFESILEPIQQRQDHIGMYFDPRTCPEPFIAWLASWLDLAPAAHLDEARRRRLVSEAMDLYHWRGTRYGLARMIELSTGLPAEVLDEPGKPAVIRVRLRLPAERGIDRASVDDLIRLNKPAHVGYILEVRP
jgi:phage tail-like protein